MKHEIEQSGFTLVEVMVALVVLIAGMLGVMGMQYMAVYGNSVSRKMSVATVLGQTQMEMLKATPFASVVSGNDTPVLDSSTSGGVVFQRRWWVRTDCAVLALGLNNAGDDPADPCGAALAAADVCQVDPDPVVVSPVLAIRVRTCWLDKYNNPHAVTFNDAKRQ